MVYELISTEPITFRQAQPWLDRRWFSFVMHYYIVRSYLPNTLPIDINEWIANG